MGRLGGGADGLAVPRSSSCLSITGTSMARELAEPLTEEFYFSLLVKYEGLDKNDFFALWFDDVAGGKGAVIRVCPISA